MPEDSDVRLYESRGETAAYICLSHCWGKSQHITTELGTLPARKAKIAWNELPKTFQNAIVFTRRLHIRYIWIDSLCIIQNDPTDWSKQASKMPEIYENAYVTLAATFSSDSSTGCFTRADECYKAQAFAVEDLDGKKHQLFVRRHVPHSKITGRHHKLEIDEEYPLLTRAWVLQERLLSPRVLHFGRHELFWECKASAACECSFLDQAEPEYLDKVQHQERLNSNRNNHAELVHAWHQIVELYTTLNMTYEKDKFNAISGLARRVNRMESDYVAGLWMDSLVADMLWEVLVPSERPSVWRAPSWSWASVNSRVTYVSELRNNKKVDSYLSILGGQAVAAGENDMGELASAYLDVEAVLTIVSLAIYARPEGSLARPEPTLAVNHIVFNPPERGSGVGLSFISDSVKLDCSIPPTTNETSFPGYGADLHTRQFLCMRFASVGDYEYSMLLDCVDHPTQKYQRIGLVTEYRGGGGARKIPWDNFEQSFQARISLV
jgi:hypothetical protein